MGFGQYVLSATTPFASDGAPNCGRMPPRWYAGCSRRRARVRPAGLGAAAALDRVYVNERARTELGWAPRCDFRHVLDLLAADEDFRSPLAKRIGSKGYHAVPTGVYTVR